MKIKKKGHRNECYERTSYVSLKIMRLHGIVITNYIAGLTRFTLSMESNDAKMKIQMGEVYM